MKKLILIVGLTLVTINITNTTISYSNISNESMIINNNLDIRPMMVDEVNRLIGSNEYTYSDRWDSIKSIEMFKIFQDTYNPNYDFHKGCRIWNGGPTGHHKESTLGYLDKALIQLETIINNF